MADDQFGPECKCVSQVLDMVKQMRNLKHTTDFLGVFIYVDRQLVGWRAYLRFEGDTRP